MNVVTPNTLNSAENEGEVCTGAGARRDWREANLTALVAELHEPLQPAMGLLFTPTFSISPARAAGAIPDVRVFLKTAGASDDSCAARRFVLPGQSWLFVRALQF